MGTAQRDRLRLGSADRAPVGAATPARTASATDVPPEEINLIEDGKHYGFPFFIGRNLPNPRPELKDAAPDCHPRTRLWPRRWSCRRTSRRIDLRFYTGTQFPAAYRNALFLALHGSTTIPPKSATRSSAL